MYAGSSLKPETPQGLARRQTTPWQLQGETAVANDDPPILTLHGAPVACYIATWFDGKLVMTLPLTLQPVIPGTAEGKTRPDVMLTDENGTAQITLTQLYQKVVSDADVLEYQSQVKLALKKLNPALEWLREGVKEVGGLRIAFFEVSGPRLSREVYQLSFFLPLRQRMLSGKLICAAAVINEWRSVFHQIIESIQVKRAEKQTFRNLLLHF